jgi:hypothetical protein
MYHAEDRNKEMRIQLALQAGVHNAHHLSIATTIMSDGNQGHCANHKEPRQVYKWAPCSYQAGITLVSPEYYADINVVVHASVGALSY